MSRNYPAWGPLTNAECELKVAALCFQALTDIRKFANSCRKLEQSARFQQLTGYYHREHYYGWFVGFIYGLFCGRINELKERYNYQLTGDCDLWIESVHNEWRFLGDYSSMTEHTTHD